MRVAGIDTSLTSTGVAVVHDERPLDFGGLELVDVTTCCVESKPPKRARGDKTPIPIRDRRDRIARIVMSIGDAAFDADMAVVEAPSYGSQGASTWDRAWLWGAVIDGLIGNGVPVAIVAPRCRALWACGSGAASKSPVAVHLSRMWPNVDPAISDDEWDALALATMGAQHLGLIPVELARHREQLAKVPWPTPRLGTEAAS